MFRLPFVRRGTLEAVTADYAAARDRLKRCIGEAELEIQWHRAQMANLQEAMLSDRARYIETVTRLNDTVSSERARFQNLLDKFTMLKLQGFTEPAAPAAPVERKAVDPILAAIALKAGSSRALRKQMTAQVAKDRLNGVDEAEIEKRILGGVSLEDVSL